MVTVAVLEKGSRVAASKVSFRTGKLRAIQCKEDWCLWASKPEAAIRTGGDEEDDSEGNHRVELGHGDPIYHDAALMEAQAGVLADTGDPGSPSRESESETA